MGISMVGLFAYVTQLEAAVGAQIEAADPTVEEVGIQTFRPYEAPAFPLFYNRIRPAARHELRDTGTDRDYYTVTATIAVQRTDAESDMTSLLAYGDLFIGYVDDQLWNHLADLDGVRGINAAHRLGMADATDQWGDTAARCFDFPILFDITKPIR